MKRDFCKIKKILTSWNSYGLKLLDYSAGYASDLQYLESEVLLVLVIIVK